MGSVSTTYNPADHCPIIQTLHGDGPMGELGDNAIFELGRDGVGCEFKVYGDTSGSYLLWDQSANELVLYRTTFTENENVLDIDVYPTDATHGCRQGAINCMMYRSTALTSWDGNGDIAMRVYSYNYGVNSTARGGTRGMEVLARNRTGSCSWVNGGYFTAENYTGSAGIDSMVGLEVHAKNNGVAASTVKVLRVYDESQSYTGTTYAIEIDCTNASAFEREYCIYINSGADSSWANGLTFDGNITNALDFADNDGTNGATLGTHSSHDTNPSGHIKVDVAGATRYIYLYTNPVTFS